MAVVANGRTVTMEITLTITKTLTCLPDGSHNPSPLTQVYDDDNALERVNSFAINENDKLKTEWMKCPVAVADACLLNR